MWCRGVGPEKAILQCSPRNYNAQIQFAIYKCLFLFLFLLAAFLSSFRGFSVCLLVLVSCLFVKDFISVSINSSFWGGDRKYTLWLKSAIWGIWVWIEKNRGKRSHAFSCVYSVLANCNIYILCPKCPSKTNSPTLALVIPQPNLLSLNVLKLEMLLMQVSDCGQYRRDHGTCNAQKWGCLRF